MSPAKQADVAEPRLDGRTGVADFLTLYGETFAERRAWALRTEAGRNPYDRGLTDLVGQLCTRSAEFRGWWATHDVKLHYSATKMIHHPIAGDLELTGEALQLPGDPELCIITYTWEPASPTAEAIAFLASYGTVTHEQSEPQK